MIDIGDDTDTVFENLRTVALQLRGRLDELSDDPLERVVLGAALTTYRAYLAEKITPREKEITP